MDSTGYYQQQNYYPQQQQQQESGEWFQNSNDYQAPSTETNSGFYYPEQSAPQYTSQGFAPPPPSAPQTFSLGETSINGGEGFGSFADEPPLLDELGVNFSHIVSKTAAVLMPTRKINEDFLEDTDMAGPLVFCVAQAFILTLKLQIQLIGYVFGFGLIGSVMLYMVINLMNHASAVTIDIYRVVSILGYNLLPMIGLSAITVLINLNKLSLLFPLTLLAVAWSTLTATRFFEAATRMTEQRYLISYPVFLFYSIFALISVF